MAIIHEKIDELVKIIKAVGDKNKSLNKGEQVYKDWKVDSIFDEEDFFECGFYGAALINSQNEILITFRGTDFSQPNDVITDLAIGLDHVSKQMETAYHLYKKYANSNNQITLVGHSLGGGLAEFVGAISGAQTYTLNGIGVKHLLNNIDKSKYIIKNADIEHCPNIENYISKIDVVGNLLEHCSNNSFYIDEPARLLNNPIELPHIIIELKLIKHIVGAANTIEDFIHANIPGNLFKVAQPREGFLGWMAEAHDIDNFEDISDNYSRNNDLL